MNFSPYGASHPTASFAATPPTPTQHIPNAATTTAATTSVLAEPAVEKIRRHPQYYLIGGDVHFLVENFLFRVHRYFFERESAIFREKLAVPAVPGASARGSSDTNPFPLEDVQAVDFSRFLWVFYNPKYSIYDAQVDDWSAILKLSYEWRFAEVKQLACRELEKFTIEPVKKIYLYQCYEVDRKLLIPSYSALTFRPEPLSLKEGRLLGLETALLLAEAREYARGPTTPSGAHSPSSASLDQDQMTDIITRIFGINMLAAPPPEETGDVFGIVPASPPRTPMTVPSTTIGNAASTHSRQPSKNLARAPSPPLLNTSMPSIAQTLIKTPSGGVDASVSARASTPAQERKPDSPPAVPAKAGDATPNGGDKAADAKAGTGQAVTSSPPSSIIQRLMPASQPQEESQQRPPQLAVQIPQAPPTTSKTEQPEQVTQDLTPSPAHSRPGANQEKDPKAGLSKKAAKRAAKRMRNDTPTTTPVVDTPSNMTHDVNVATQGEPEKSEIEKGDAAPKDASTEANASSQSNGDVAVSQPEGDAIAEKGKSKGKGKAKVSAEDDGKDKQPEASENKDAESKQTEGGKGTQQTGDSAEKPEDADGKQTNEDATKGEGSVEPNLIEM